MLCSQPPRQQASRSVPSEGVSSISKVDGRFEVESDAQVSYSATSVIIATGGTRVEAGARLASSFGHAVQPATPSLFTFKIADPRLEGLAGLSVADADVRIQRSKLESSGPVLITHWGLSGPGILKISSWGARELADRDYSFDVSVNWIPGTDPAEVFAEKRHSEGKRSISGRSPFAEIPKRLWQRLVTAAGISDSTTWAELSKSHRSLLVDQLTVSTFAVHGKSMNKDEFVTCGGVSLGEIDFTTMESRLVDGLYFAGEVIDVDGITGGFNFQNAWTTGHHAGRAVAASTSGAAAPASTDTGR